MSESFYWRVIKQDGTCLNVSAPSAFREAMEVAFGDGPWCLTAGRDSDKLRAMAAVLGMRADYPNPYQELADILDGYPGAAIELLGQQ